MIDARHNIGNKFNEDGSFRFFPGNTVISKLDHSAPVWQEFLTIRGMLEALPAAHCATMLPDDSIHMTVFEGVCHQWRKPELWTSLLPLDCRLSETDDLMERAIASVPPLGPVNMRMESVRVSFGSSIRLVPATQDDADELHRYREACSAATGIRHPIHDTYGYHLSICYFTTTPTDEEEAQLRDFGERATAYIRERGFVFPILPPKLTYFNNMYDFTPIRFDRNGL